MPRYLFCDCFDLSYILKHILRDTKIAALKGKCEFAQDELLFLELLCFSARDQLSFKLIRSIKHYLDKFIKGLKEVKGKV